MHLNRRSAALAATVLCALAAIAQAIDKPSRPLFSAFEKFYRFQTAATRVEAGAADQAVGYYQALAKATSMPDARLPDRLDGLLQWFGCTTTARELETTTPAQLNAGPQPITSLRYFSPKTTDVSGRQKPQLLSWRKVMRVRAAAGSPAEKAGIRDLWWLTNVYTAEAAKPFEQASQNNQIILVPQSPVNLAVGGAPAESHAILFAVYGPAAAGYPLARSTATSWDGGTVNIDRPDDPTQEYFVPQSCIQCHGGRPRNGRLNVLDTDYYIWRSGDAVDFPGLKDRLWWTTDRDGFVFAAAHQLNEEILTQNRQVDAALGGEPSFTTQLTADWMARHDRNFALAPAVDRGWSGKHPELVDLLVKYCYRCHGTVEFSVLDGRRIGHNVDGRREALLDRLGADMPQDRDWETNPQTNADLERLRVLLLQLQD